MEMIPMRDPRPQKIKAGSYRSVALNSEVYNNLIDLKVATGQPMAYLVWVAVKFAERNGAFGGGNG